MATPKTGRKPIMKQAVRWDYKASATIKGASDRMPLWQWCEDKDILWLIEEFKRNGIERSDRTIERAIRLRVDRRDRVKEVAVPRNARRGTEVAEADTSAEALAMAGGRGVAGTATAPHPYPSPSPAIQPRAPERGNNGLGLLGKLVRQPVATEPLRAEEIRAAYPGGTPDKTWHLYEEDPVTWCLEKHPKIEDKAGSRVPFVPYQWQHKPMRYFWEGGHYFVEKSRQEGFSTCILIAASHALVYSLPVQGVSLRMPIVADKEKTALKLLKIVKLALYSADLTDEERERLTHADPKNKSGDVTYLVEDEELEGESWIEAHTSTGSAARGDAYNAALLEEFAWADNAQDIWNSVRPVVRDIPLARFWVISTPHGATFHSDLCDNAEQYGAHYLPMDWRACGEGRLPDGRDRDEAWRRRQDVEMGEKLAAQECDLMRIGAGDHLVDEAVVREWASKTPWVGPEPIAGHRYSKAVDLAGPGQDLDVHTVLDVTRIPAQVVFQKEYAHEATAAKIRRIEELDRKWPGPLRIDGTNNAEVPAQVRSPNKYAVRFRGEQEEKTKYDEVERLRWEHRPRENMSNNLVRALETGSLVVHEQFFTKLWEALRTAQYAKINPMGDGYQLERSQKAKRRGKHADYWDSAMMSAVEVKVVERRAGRIGQVRVPTVEGDGPGRRMRERLGQDGPKGSRRPGRMRGLRF